MGFYLILNLLLFMMKVSHGIESCRYGGFSLGARSAQVLPPAHEVDDAIERIRKIFELQKVSVCACVGVFGVLVKG